MYDRTIAIGDLRSYGRGWGTKSEALSARTTADKNPKSEQTSASYIDRDLLKGTWRQFSNFRRPKPRTENFAGHAALIDNRYKLHKVGADLERYDLAADAAEATAPDRE